MTQEIKIGDRVMCTDDGNLGIVTFVDIDEGKGINNGYEVKFDNGDEEWISADMIVLSEEPPYDRAKDFATRLGELLREFNAELGYSPDNAIIASIDVGCHTLTEIWWDMPKKKWAITPDNVMDFEDN